MNKVEFLNGLREALVLKMDERQMQEQLRYYGDYIDDEVRQGRAEIEVVEELGDPWALAKNLAGNEVLEAEYIHHETMNEDGDVEPEQRTRGTGQGKSFTWSSHSSLGCWIFAIIFFAILFGILYLLVGAIKVLLPFIIPVIIVMIILRLIQSFFR